MSYEPPFDDDELINDYNQEDFPEEYEDECFDELMEENDPTEMEKDEHPNKMTDLNSDGDNVEESAQVEKTDAFTGTVILSKSEIGERDLYSFERYEGSKNWRQETDVEKNGKGDVMQAVSWKIETDTIRNPRMNLGYMHKNNAAESQLVQFCAFDYSCSDICNSRRYMTQAPSIPMENEDTIPLTLSTGRRLFIKKAAKIVHTGNVEVDRALLGISMDELNQRAEANDRKRDRSRKRMKVNLNDESSERVTDTIVQGARNIETDRLWVDKHAPSHFSDLLSDERINREVLRALRQWDPFVFGKDAPVRQSYFKDDDKKDSSMKPVEKQANDTRPDERNRVILLCGPPGVGKTTLAHIIAKHAGYRPLEVNASDERSATVLTDRVTRAMESSTLITSSGGALAGRPNCLILDEIDGADAKGSIKAIVNIIRAEKPQKDAKKKGKTTYLRRPIIFICNHKHAPALKPLLPYAKQFDVKAPLTSRLVSRLKAILASERMALVGGNSLLHQLVEISGGDIRSCLFTLQFASARAKEIAAYKRRNDENFDKNISTVDITSALVPSLSNETGSKDERNDFTGTLTSIFRKNKKGGKGYNSSSVQNKNQRDVERILESVDCFGDNSKTLDALFLNILSVSYVDPTMDRCWTAHEWLSSVDVYRSYTSSVAMNNSSEHRTMQKFHLPTAAAAIHLLCRVETKSDLMYSLRQLLDTSYQLEANESLVDKFLEGLPPSVRSASQRKHLVSDVIPYCMWLLSAGAGRGALNRPVSSFDILTKEEKSSFEAHVAILRSLGLTYVLSENGDAVTSSMDNSMRLEPEIDKISLFKGFKTKREVIPNLLKELLAHATTVASITGENKGEKMMNEENRSETNLNPESEINDTPREKDIPLVEQNTMITEVFESKSNFLGIGAAKAKAARSARKAADVGFDRSKSRKKLSNSGSGRPIDQVLRYKYQKGFTQAVRLPCSKDDLLL